MTTPAGSFNYAYDGIGRSSKVTFPNSTGWQYQYAANGLLQLAQATDPNPQHPTRTTRYDYNNLGMLSSLTNWFGNTTVSTFNQMRYDAAGNRVAMTSTLPQNGNAPDASRYLGYSYDHLDQLTGEGSQPLNPSMNDPYHLSYNYGFSYDAVGNAQSFRSGGTLSVNGDNQLSDPAFQYDGNGNPTTYANIPGMTFDPENHLTTVPGMMQAGYDSDDLRAWKSGSSPQGPMPGTYFLYDGDTAIAEEDMNGNVLAWNGYGADGLRTRYTTNPAGGANQTLHYAYDPSGNLTNRLDPNGQSSNTTVFDAFGQLRAQINAATGQPELNPDPVGFSGQWGAYTDPETKLVLMTHRYYDPSHGRWLNRDPIGYGGGVNLYGYCGNNPVTWVDPDGFGPVPGAGLPNGYRGKQRLNPDAAQMINDAINAQPYADALGWLPGVPGILGNGFSALVSVGKGEYGAAAGSVAAMIPFEKVAGRVLATGEGLTRREAFKLAKARAGIPRSASPIRQWTVGNNAMRAGTKSYRYSLDRGAWGRYYEYRTSKGLRVIAEHLHDGRPHFHVGEPKPNRGPGYDFKNDRYMQLGGVHHHIYYRR